MLSPQIDPELGWDIQTVHTKYEELFDTVEEYKHLVDDIIPWHSQIHVMAKKFKYFTSLCKAKRGLYPEHYFSTDPVFGTIGCHDEIALAFLCHIRYRGSHSKIANPLKVSTILNQWYSTINGLQVYITDHSMLSPCSHPKSTPGHKYKKLIATWRGEDESMRGPIAYLMPEDIHTYCMVIMWSHMQESITSAEMSTKILFALVLRLQCGSGARHYRIQC